PGGDRRRQSWATEYKSLCRLTLNDRHPSGAGNRKEISLQTDKMVFEFLCISSLPPLRALRVSSLQSRCPMVGRVESARDGRTSPAGFLLASFVGLGHPERRMSPHRDLSTRRSP